MASWQAAGEMCAWELSPYEPLRNSHAPAASKVLLPTRCCKTAAVAVYLLRLLSMSAAPASSSFGRSRDVPWCAGKQLYTTIAPESTLPSNRRKQMKFTVNGHRNGYWYNRSIRTDVVTLTQDILKTNIKYFEKSWMLLPVCEDRPEWYQQMILKITTDTHQQVHTTITLGRLS